MNLSRRAFLLGSGVPLLPEGQRCKLKLIESKTRPSGIVLLKYDVVLPGRTA